MLATDCYTLCKVIYKYRELKYMARFQKLCSFKLRLCALYSINLNNLNEKIKHNES